VDSGLQRKISLQNLMFPVADSLWKAKKIEFKPDVVIGTGFASGPLKMASMMGTYRNSRTEFYPGITNKLLSKKSRCNLCGV
jgi:UDP-N-acetylglucosamine:LPS N-acetylglucosamine transferase